MDLQLYRENRSRFSLANLREHQGHWVAFSMDGSRIIASNEDLAALDDLVKEAGEDPEQVALEHIELDDVCLGGAEIGCVWSDHAANG